jgi:sialic acid synthase SpsE
MEESMIEIIAEIGVNHNGDMERAGAMICAAKRAGADVAKFQVYDTRATLPLDHPVIKRWLDLLLETELTKEQVKFLATWCATCGIEFMASVFQPERVEWLEAVNVRRYKIASRSMYDLPLAQAIAATYKPVIVSYGHDDGREPAIFECLSPNLITRLSCVAEYPAPYEGLFKPREFWAGKWDGLSDHTPTIWASVMAMGLGARVIEKHVTFDRSLPGPDQAASITFEELRMLCEARDVIGAIRE